MALVAPDAWPASSGLTEDSTALAAGANTSAMPVPPMMNAGTSSRDGGSAGNHGAKPAGAAGANTSAMPVPPMMNAGTSSRYGVSTDTTVASHAIAIDCSARPATIS